MKQININKYIKQKQKKTKINLKKKKKKKLIKQNRNLFFIKKK